MKYNLFYRGSLNYCNYNCCYCPFINNFSLDKTVLKKDEMELNKFVRWIDKNTGDNFSVMFTPMGEGLIFPWYKKNLIKLSFYKNIESISIQTNLSCNMKWTKKANNKKFFLWITYHPIKTNLNLFLKKCNYLIKQNIKFSIGVVGLKGFLKKIIILRKKMPINIYLWINAYKINNYYTKKDIETFQNIDPYFKINLKDYNNFNKKCLTGYNSFFIKGNGNILRCHQINKILGNIYKDKLKGLKSVIPCSKQKCSCYIGYINIPELELNKIYGNNLISRIPNNFLYNQ